MFITSVPFFLLAFLGNAVAVSREWYSGMPTELDSSIHASDITDNSTNPSDEKKFIAFYCYPFSVKDINGKCYNKLISLDANIVILPLMNEVQTMYSLVYYSEVEILKNKLVNQNPKYKIYGIFFDKPGWHLIVKFLTYYPNLFEGLLIDWTGDEACIWNIDQPTASEWKNIQQHFEDVFYFYREQNCDKKLMKALTNGYYYNPNSKRSEKNLSVTKGRFPSFLTPVFSCFGGEEGRCYGAHHVDAKRACSNTQLYAWSPLEPSSSLIMSFHEEVCGKMNNHLLFNVA